MYDFKPTKKTIVTLGTFDGVHIGHQKIIEKLLQNAKEYDCESLILTFFPHPRMVLQEGSDIKLLNTIDERSVLLDKLGLDNLIIHPFDNEFSRLSADEFVKTIFPNFDWIGDKKIVDGCSKRRPDLLLDLGYQIIIVEIDENQHIDYDCSCENKRIMELSQDLSHRPIIFIRFNPDNYNDNGINVTSCWGQNKNGLCVIKKSKKNEWTERLNTLERQISYWVNPENKTSKTVEIIQLFYDV